MTEGGTLASWKRAGKRILRLAGRPARTAQGERGIVIEPYRGYGSRTEIFLIGRVFWQSRSERARADGASAARGVAVDDFVGDLRDIGRRIARRAVRGAPITASFCGTDAEVVTDGEGYFRVHLRPEEAPPTDRDWHSVELRLDQPRLARAKGTVFIPPERCRYVVISDIDDTIMQTGVANKLKMLWRLFVQDADRRVAFPGVAALCRALHAGRTGDQDNPLLYVSRAPWGIYGVLDEFFRLHRIPVGPIMFLREWGITWRSPLPRKAEDHKRDLIRNMLKLYGDLPFVLIGDSGQHDPEVYRQIVDEHPGRVVAVYIRNVSRDPARIREVEELASAVAAAGSSLLLASDSLAIARHAAKLGLLAPDSVQVVHAEALAEGGSRTAGKTRRVRHPTTHGAGGSSGDGELHKILGERSAEAPPNVVVEGERPR